MISFTKLMLLSKSAITKWKDSASFDFPKEILSQKLSRSLSVSFLTKYLIIECFLNRWLRSSEKVQSDYSPEIC